MKYGESTFDILYLLFAILSGILLLVRRKDLNGRLMGFAALILGCGDAFHLVPRVLNYFIEADFTVALGVGKLITSITMTIFYVLMYHVWAQLYRHILQVDNASGKTVGSVLPIAVYCWAAIRIILCVFPQNGWFQNESPLVWAILRNIPFVILGLLIVILYWKIRKSYPTFRLVWLLITLSFAFYIPVAVGAGFVPILGMLMLPKTICYILLIVVFWMDTVRKQHDRQES